MAYACGPNYLGRTLAPRMLRLESAMIMPRSPAWMTEKDLDSKTKPKNPKNNEGCFIVGKIGNGKKNPEIGANVISVFALLKFVI